ncbi:MAG: hypothetical protein ISQ32_04995 [Rickettsiales bacterium]|nr:hypothetical protein [Rickettsiales bacterium]
MSEIRVLIHCALFFEAEIFIKNYNLKKDISISEFMFFYNHDSKIALITSTKSLLAVGFSVGYIHAKYNFHNDIKFLNFGIAGSKNLALGSIKEIVKVTDYSTSISYYPIYQNNPIFDIDTLISFAKPNDDYNLEGLYDMEASAFFESVSKITDRENIRILKIISDNKEQTLKNFDHNLMKKFITDKSEDLFNYVSILKSNIETTQPTLHFNNFTFSENKIINNLFNQLRSLNDNFDFDDIDISNYHELKKFLESEILKYKLSY